MSRTTLDEISQTSILTPIRLGAVPGDPRLSFRNSLEVLLRVAMERIDKDGPSSLRNIATLVFAEWTLLDLPGPGDGWLLLSAAFNGEPTQYLLDLRAEVGPEMDTIYGHCIGYPGSGDADAFLAYAQAHTIQTHVFYPAAVLRHRTMRELRRLSHAGLDHRPERSL